MNTTTAKLAEVAVINPSMASNSSLNDELVAFVPMAAVSANPPAVAILETRSLSSVKNGFSYFQNSDILVAKITPCFENGKIAQAYIEQHHGFGSTEFHVVRPSQDRVDARYLLHFLRQDCIRIDGKRKMTGSAGQRRVPKHFLETLEIPLPPIAEQKRIAAILDKAEELRGLRRRALSQLDAIAQSIFLEMFGDPATNPKGWTILSLANLVSEFRYGSSNKSQPYGKPALRIPNVIGGSLDLADLKLVPVDDSEFERLRMQNGDILFVRTNGNPDFVGRCAVFDYRLVANTGFAEDKFIFASYLIRARLALESIMPLFLREFLLGTSGRRELRSRCKTSAGQFNVNIPSLGAIPIPIPPLSLQQEFARRVEAIEQLKTTHRESLAQLDTLFACLQYRAFSPSETLRERGEL